MNNLLDDAHLERFGNAAALVPPLRRESFMWQVCNRFTAQDCGADGDANTLEGAV